MTRLHELVAIQAGRTPGAVAVRDAAGELTYAELLTRATATAERLRAHGVGPDVVVGVCAHRSAALPVALLAILLAGGVYLPLDPDDPPNRLAYLVDTASARFVLTTDATADRFLGRPVALFTLDGQARGTPPVGSPASSSVGADHLAYVMFTSGSTGRPKGVGIPHRGVVNRLRWMQRYFRATPTDTVLQKTPYTFDVSVWELFWPLMCGARLVMADPMGHRDPEYLAETIVREHVTVAHFVPSMLALFLDEPTVTRCESLRTVIASGEALPPALANRFAGRLSARLYNLYGPTEASIDVTAWACRSVEPGPTVPIGTPIDGVETHVLDERGTPAPTGELYLGGDCLARGYLGAPGLTAERFVADHHSGRSGRRLYRTGDLVRRDADGNLEFLGRLDHQVKLRGIRIELGEIETALCTHPAVRHAVAVVREVLRAPKIAAYVVLDPARDADPAELRDHLSTLLPEYMIPTFLSVVDRFPVTANGKLDRAALPDPLEGRT